MILRRLLCLIFCFCFLPIPARGETDAKYVALTFDDGPSGRYTARLLEGLAQRNVTATFFLCGYRMKEYPALTQKIQDQGHEIGLHGFSHSSMKSMDAQALERELNDSMSLLPTGCRPMFLRPPGGAVSKGVQDAARRSGLAILNWSVDPRDWDSQDVPAITAAVTSNIRPGDVILLHDMSDSSVDAALAIVDHLQKQGFCFVSAKELARLRGYPTEPGRIYKHFR